MKELVIYKDEKGEWNVTSEQIPGFIARGKTREDAIDKMKQAFTVYFPCGSDCKSKE